MFKTTVTMGTKQLKHQLFDLKTADAKLIISFCKGEYYTDIPCLFGKYHPEVLRTNQCIID